MTKKALSVTLKPRRGPGQPKKAPTVVIRVPKSAVSAIKKIIGK